MGQSRISKLTRVGTEPTSTSVPIDQASQQALQQAQEGRIHNASGRSISQETIYVYEKSSDDNDTTDEQTTDETEAQQTPAPGDVGGENPLQPSGAITGNAFTTDPGQSVGTEQTTEVTPPTFQGQPAPGDATGPGQQ